MTHDTAFVNSNPGTEIQHRIKQLQSLFLSNGIDGAIISICRCGFSLWKQSGISESG